MPLASIPALPGVELADCGASALRVSASTGDAERDWRLVHHLARAMSASTPSIVSVIPTYESVLVEFDAMAATSAEVRARLEQTLCTLDLEAPLSVSPRRFTVPVVYGGEFGPDLDEVAALAGLTPSEVIDVHTSARYTVRCLGAPGGSPMLDAPAALSMIPRLESPRTAVPQGVVSLAGRQATLTPAAAPGGWRFIGRTPLRVLSLEATPFVPYRPGDEVRFSAIDAARFAELDGELMAPDEGGDEHAR